MTQKRKIVECVHKYQGESYLCISIGVRMCKKKREREEEKEKERECVSVI